MEKKLNDAVDDVVTLITECEEFKECIRLKEKLEENSEIKELISTIKCLQKKYVQTQDYKVKEELDRVNERLNSIPLYDSYNKKIAEVNDKIEFVKTELNTYFNEVVNPKK